MTKTIEPGTVIRVNTSELGVRRGASAIFLRATGDGVVHLLTDAGIAMATRKEITVPRHPLGMFVPMRLRLPYGVWTEANGSKVLFSRDYYPLWRISADGGVSPEDPWLWISFVNQEWFWDDAHTPWRSKEKEKEIEKRMVDLNISGTPKLLGVIELLIEGRASDIPKAVKLMSPS